ncbi:unnamed protein product [Ilex paraguariensis]|uniref:Uncharacterized protein n=1 Tax=Ilex paraguariensis TaxID=185542 RepID=A0ABC8URT6_9AQUA
MKNLINLDLSNTNIKSIPILRDIGALTHLFVRDCQGVERLRSIKSLSKLQVLDLSGSSINEFRDQSLEPNNLPTLNSLSKLEVIDLSGCGALTVIEDESFEQMSCLQSFSLSDAKIERLPSLSNLNNLRYLSLRKCTNLKLVVEPLTTLLSLEELHLCCISSLTQADFLEQMSHLHILDLSETQLEKLSSMSNLKNLVHLSLRGCKQLRTVQHLEALTKLEILDLSGTAVMHLPSLTNLSNLHQFLPSNCLSSEELKNLEMLDLSGDVIKEESTDLENLDLPT